MKRILFVLLALLLVGCTSDTTTMDMQHKDNLKEFEIAPSELDEMIKDNANFKLIDVREQNEFDEGYVERAMLLPVGEITQERLDEMGIGKEDVIVVYCRSGKRSEKAYNALKEMGYGNVRSLGGGIVHWQEDGYSIKKGAMSNDMVIKDSLYIGRKEYDFGKIRKEDGVVSTDFIIENRGSNEIKLSYAGSSCGCTTGMLDKDNIKAGEKATLSLEFDPNYHKEPEGRFSRTVFIETNVEGNEEIEFKVYMEIVE